MGLNRSTNDFLKDTSECSPPTSVDNDHTLSPFDLSVRQRGEISKLEKKVVEVNAKGRRCDLTRRHTAYRDSGHVTIRGLNVTRDKTRQADLLRVPRSLEVSLEPPSSNPPPPYLLFLVLLLTS